MAEQEFAFEHSDGFEQGELAAQVRLGKFEAHYEEIFAEVIEDGVITPEERARLHKAADALGLDRTRIKNLEAALQAAYEARHHVRIRDESAEEDAPASLVLGPQAAANPRVALLERRVQELQQKVADLARELAEARSQVAVEVDLSNLAASGGPVEHPVDERADDLTRRLHGNPRDVEALHALYRVHERAGDQDRRWLVSQALVYLDAAHHGERETYARGRVEGLIKPTHSVSSEGHKLLFHPDEEVLTGQIFAVIAPAVLLGRISTLRRDRVLPKLDPQARQDPKMSTLQAVRCFSWAGAILGLGSPPLYADPEYPGSVEMVPGVPPAARLGRSALSGRSPFELAFIAGRHLSYLREQHFIRLLVTTIADLEDLFLAALSIANANIPLSSEIRQRVEPLARAIEPVLDPAAIDHLRGHFFRFLDEGGRTNLRRWATAADRTAARAGLLLANGLDAAHAVFESEDPASVDSKMDDLIVFSVGDRYARLRRQIGLAAD